MFYAVVIVNKVLDKVNNHDQNLTSFSIVQMMQCSKKTLIDIITKFMSVSWELQVRITKLENPMFLCPSTFRL